MGLAVVALLASALSAAPEKGSEPPLVVRLGVDLVQIDAVVTDKKGRPVTDLVAADFEVLQDGRPRAVTQAAYMGSAAAAGAPGPAASSLGGEAPPADELSEALVFVVDDLALSLSSVAATSRALLRFADGMDPEMRVFLLRTSNRIALMRPVEGPAELRAAARALRYRPQARGANLLEDAGGLGVTPFDLQAQATTLYLSGLLARQSLLSLQDITDALRSWKGRKTLVLFSDGFPIWDPRAREVMAPLDQVYGRGEDVLDAVDRLTDLANRASVVIHTVDPRGLVAAGISASDALTSPASDAVSNLLLTRRTALHTSQAGLSYLAERTGGVTVVNSNDLGAGVARILSGSRGYYLVGYEPERATFGPERPRFHRLEVKVKRPGLKVRSRKGFFGVSDEAVAALAPPQAF